ncbi:Asp-tRNA(Asn)/Glu-tRNA(Gln) amidotransferase GatCAB subunit B, partial [Clostridium sporogenes]
PEKLSELVKLINAGTLADKISKKVLDDMLKTCKNPEDRVEEKGLDQNNDEGAILEVVKKIMENNPQSIEDFKNGKKRALGFLVGLVMKETKGKANPQIVNKLVSEEANKM